MSKYRYLFFLGLSTMVVGCSLFGTEQLGDVPPQVRIDAIKPAKHNKEDVIRLLGSPTSVTLFEKESWLYLESKEQNRLFLPQKEIERRLVQITFKPTGVVESVHNYTLEDGQEIAFDSQKTPVEGKNLSITDEMIGNFGRFPSTKSH